MSKVIPIRESIGGEEGWQFHLRLVEPKRSVNWDKVLGLAMLAFSAGMMVLIIWQVGRVI